MKFVSTKVPRMSSLKINVLLATFRRAGSYAVVYKGLDVEAEVVWLWGFEQDVSAVSWFPCARPRRFDV